MKKLSIRVKQMENKNFRAIPNQFIIYTSQGTYFQSYQSIIALMSKGKIYLDREYWDYSTTTGKYRNQFLNEKKPETERKIKQGIYTLTNLN